MEEPVITVGGPPGSGKTTAARRLAEQLHLTHVSAGELFRAEAARRNLSLADFGKLAETDPSIDHRLDEEMILRAQPRTLLEGRIIGELLARRRIPVFRISVTASETVRAARLARRDGGTASEVQAAMRIREASEHTRYLRYYGIDLQRLSVECSIDASVPGPDQVVELILRQMPRSLLE